MTTTRRTSTATRSATPGATTAIPDAAGTASHRRHPAGREQRAGQHRQPLDIPASALQLREVGEIEPWHRLIGTLRIAGVPFHVDAVAIESAPLARQGLQAVGADLQASFARACDGLHTEGGFAEVALPTSDGRQHYYVIFIVPYPAEP
jgi:hypothetical protein